MCVRFGVVASISAYVTASQGYGDVSQCNTLDVVELFAGSHHFSSSALEFGLKTAALDAS